MSFSGAVVLLGDELAVPAQDGVRRHQAGELFQRTSADEAALRGEPPALGNREAQAPTAELFPKGAVLLLEVRDDVGLVAVHPAREHQEQELQVVEKLEAYGPKLGASFTISPLLKQLAADGKRFQDISSDRAPHARRRALLLASSNPGGAPVTPASS